MLDVVEDHFRVVGVGGAGEVLVHRPLVALVRSLVKFQEEFAGVFGILPRTWWRKWVYRVIKKNQ